MKTKIKAHIPTRIRLLKLGRFTSAKGKELPADLLVEIFLLCLPGPNDSFPIPSRREIPILFGRVCRLWRSVSLNTPQLWAQIQLSASYPVDIWKSENFHRIGIHEWIRRSGNSPLSFDIGWHGDIHASAPSLALTLQAEAHRWKSIRLRSTCHCVNHILQMLSIPGKVPMLIDLRFLNEVQFQTNHSIICVPKNLSTIYLRSNDTSLLGNGRFHALRELRINPYGSSRAYSFILTQCPSLETLKIISSPYLQLNDMQTVVHSLHCLHTFIIDGSSGYGQLRVLNWFDTPALNSLAISIWQETNRQFTGAADLANFLMRCGSQLQRLKLAGGFLSGDDLIETLRHTPVLESLCIECITLTKDLTTLCPRLVNFDILATPFRSDVEYLDIVTAVDTVHSRWKESKSERSTLMSPSTVRVPSNLLWVVMQQKIRECTWHGLYISQLPPDSDSWWAAHLPWPDLIPRS
ncbi:hypothetical protein BD410DRAFT_212865 [Rickenella mellea]|uniref:Uncharacterized protein n=1 Tax=Rickenella mellea TaxID=50990 RepID=A0A4Y7Q5S4_9AGAM|nr:hypothetical protein BD410DRAFT_212865 [Rickenella mellea]